MRRLTISIDDSLADEFDSLVERNAYLNRSEAFRDLVRQELTKNQLALGAAQLCVATVSYVYDHHARQLPQRLVQHQHDYHDLTITSQHVHLDHDNCLETVILKGAVSDVRACAQGIISQTGVRHGNIHIVALDVEQERLSRAAHIHMHPHR
jgi:CopG family nickel-responsive transcriptional regulator